MINAKGFYISRYEAGADGGKLEENKWTETPTLVSKKGVTVWNYISQNNCKIEAKKFINNSNVKSALISGIQWDVVMKFIGNNKKDGNGNKFDVEVYDNSRHTGSRAKTGQNLADKVCNIYDLEGNCREYIAEKNKKDSSLQYVLRGGSYDINGHTPAMTRHGDYSLEWVTFSFRFVLYVL